MKKLIRNTLLSVLCAFGLGLCINVNASDAVAKIGDVEYNSIPEAVAAVPNDGTLTTIEVLKDFTGDGVSLKGKNAVGKNFVIDFKGHTQTLSAKLVGSTGTESQNYHLEKGSTIKLKNGKLIMSSNSAMLIQNYCDLTLEDMILDGSGTTRSGAYTLSSNNGKVNIIGNTSILAKATNYAFDMCATGYYPDGTQITVDTTGTIKGIIQLDIWGSLPKDNKATLLIKNMNLDGKFDIDPQLASCLTIEGGTYASQPVKEEIQEGYGAYEVVSGDNQGKYVVVENDTLSDKLLDPKTLDTVEDTTKTLIGEALEEGFEVAGYYDVDCVKVTEDGDVVAYVEETDKTMKVTLAIPENLPEVAEGYTREYQIIRLHGREATALETTDNGDGTVSAESDKFSTYAVSYKDTANTQNREADEDNNSSSVTSKSNPKTGDAIILFVVMMVLGLTGVVVTTKKLANR